MNSHYPADWLILELQKARAQLGPWSDQKGPRRYRVARVVREEVKAEEEKP